jgi:tripartite-type tricarboxylate transporter receptor subunit TctC
MRRLCIALPIAAVVATPVRAAEPRYPSRPISLIVPYPPGGGNDTLGRLVAQRLSSVLGQQVVVDNRPGAGGSIGTEMTARAKPDGYTLTLGFVANMAVAPAFGKIHYDPLKDFVPISRVAEGYQILSVNPRFPAGTVAELVAMAKARPGTLNYASGGVGTPLHLVGELFKIATQTDIRHVPYKGSPQATTAVLAGETEMVFGSVVATLPSVQSGRLRALAVTSPKRIAAAPNVPTLVELGYEGVEASSWYGLYAPAGTPAAIVQRLNAEMVKLAADPDYQEQLNKQGQVAMSSTPEDLGAYTRSESAKWSQVIKTAHIEAE